MTMLARGAQYPMAMVRSTRFRRVAYLVLALILAVLCVFPQPFVAKAKLLPQDSSSAGLSQVISTLGGQLSNFAALLTGGRPPNDLYLIIGRSDAVSSDVVERLKLAGPGRRYATVRDAKLALAKKVEVHLLLGGVVEVEAITYDPAESLALTQAFVQAISQQIGALGRQTITRKNEIVADRFAKAMARTTRAETELAAFRQRYRLPSPEIQLGSEISLRTELQARLQGKRVELQTALQTSGPENPQLRAIRTEIAALSAQVAAADRPQTGAAGPNVARLSQLSNEYLNLFRNYRFAQALYDVYARASEQVAVESLVAESATYIQIVEPPFVEPARHYNVPAIALLAAVILLALFTELYMPATGLRWSDTEPMQAR